MRISISIIVAVLASTLAESATFGQLPKDSKAIDMAALLDLGEYYVKPAVAKRDPKTGFLVAGKNDTALLKGLKEINGRTIAELEKDMRPGAKSAVGSTKGFLGSEESLLEVLAADNQYVVEQLGLSHQELAKHLHAMGTIGLWQGKHKQPEVEFSYQGRRFTVKMEVTRGIQPSPFMDDTRSGTNATVRNVDNGKQLQYALLVAHMIERYGFYEGKGTPYRVEPRQIVELFDFLKVKAGK
jgi:hypothetical protein